MAVTERTDADAPARVLGLSIDPDDLLSYDRYPFGPEGDGPGRLVELARALASSPAWSEMPDAILVVRTQPPAGLALIGRFSPGQVARIEVLPGQLRSQLSHLRYVSYQQAEEDCELLGERLVSHFGTSEVRDFTYVAIPRGGLIVLGMLSYVLGLRRATVAGAPAPGASGTPVVVVDDSALTGLRFGEFLRGQGDTQVIFAHLYSHPDLRSAILAREPRMTHVLAARDLTDVAPDLMGDDYPEWKSRWTQRANGACYWVGRPEHVCYPWAEPDFTLWNPVSMREEAGWRVVPPAATLKNRFVDGGPERLQLQPPSSGAIRVADRTYHGTLDGDAVVANLETGEVVRLRGVAAEIWRQLVAAGDPEDAVEVISRLYDADLETIRADVEQTVHRLVTRGLLAVDPAGPGEP